MISFYDQNLCKSISASTGTVPPNDAVWCAAVLGAEDLVVDVGEDVVVGFELVEPGFVVAVLTDGVEEPGEVVQVLFGSSDRVVDHGAGFHDEGPVGGLGEQQFACGLVQGAGFQASGFPVAVNQIYHALARLVEVAVDPLIRFLQPYLVVALVAPAGGVGD